MGLTIHYNLQAPFRCEGKALHAVTELRKRALDLPFQEVGELLAYRADEANVTPLANDHPHRWLLVRAEASFERGEAYYRVQPERVIAFSTMPGNGSEPANFGLALYPRVIKDGRLGPNLTKMVRTDMVNWSWGSFCKTGFAATPENGGVENFLRCHLAVLRVLDHAAKLGILQNVYDESAYWDNRDLLALKSRFGRRNALTAGWVARLKSNFGEAIAAGLSSSPPQVKAKKLA